MYIQVQCGEGADIYLKLVLLGNGICQLVIESVNPLDHKYVTVPQLQDRLIIFTVSRNEIISGQLDGLSGKKRGQNGI